MINMTKDNSSKAFNNKKAIFGELVPTDGTLTPPLTPMKSNQHKNQASSTGPVPYIGLSPTKKRYIDAKIKMRRDAKYAKLNKTALNFNAEPQMFGNVFGQGTFERLVESLESTSDKIDEIDMESINEFIANVNTSGILDKEFIASIMELSKQSSKTFDTINSVGSDSSIKTMKDIVSVSLILAVGFCGVKYSTTSDKRYLMMLTACALIFGFLHGAGIISFVRELFNTTEPQNVGFEYFDFMKLSTYLLSVYLSFTSGKSVPYELFKNIAGTGRIITSLADFIDICKKVIEAIYQYLKRTFYPDSDYRRFFVNENPIVEDIFKRSDIIESLIREDKLIPSSENAQRLDAIIVLLAEYLRSVPRKPETTNLISELQSLRNRYIKLQDSISGAGFLNGSLRVEPCVVCFKGQPGIFKTGVTSSLALELVKEIINEEEKERLMQDPKQFVFYRRTGEKYWDTYHTQHRAVVIDDFGQATDVAGTETSEYLEFIRMVNLAPFPLRMADVDSKGKKFFTSEFVIMTTNLSDIRPNSVVSAEAIKRRIDFLVNMRPKGKYGDVKFDPEKLPKLQTEYGETTTITPDMFDYELIDWKGTVLRGPFEYSELKEILLERHTLKRKYHVSLRESIKRSLSSNTESQARFRTPRVEQRITTDLYFEHEYLEWAEETLQAYGPSEVARVHFILARFESYRTHCAVTVDMCYYASKYGTYYANIFKGPSINMNALMELNLLLTEDRIHPIPVDASTSSFTSTAKEIYDNLRKSANVAIDYALAKIRWVSYFLSDPIVRLVINQMISAFMTVLFIGALSELAARVLVAVFGLGDKVFTPQSDGREVPKTKIDRNSANIKIQATPHLGSDQNGTDIMSSITTTNGYELWHKREKDIKIGYAYAVRGRVFLMPWHYLTHLSEMCKDNPEVYEQDIVFKRCSKGREIKYSISVRDVLMGHEETGLVTNDLVLVELPRVVTLHRDIVDYFLDDQVIARLNQNVDICLNFPKYGDKTTMYTTANFLDNKEVTDIDGSSYSIRSCFTYSNVDTTKGDCGALVSYNNARIPKQKIMGVHTAGNTTARVGFCSVVSRDMLLDALKKFKQVVHEDEIEPQGNLIFGSGQFNPVGTVIRGPTLPLKGDLFKTELYDQWPHFCTPDERPCEIEKFVSEKMYKQMYDKYYVENISNRDFSELVDAELCFLYSNSPNDVTPRIFTFEEAVRGLPFDPDFRGLDRSTSSGFPYNLSPKTSKKSYFFGTQPEYNLDTAACRKLREEVNEYEQLCASGIRRPQYYSDFPKYELVSSRKIQKKSMRLVSGCTIVFLISCRRYFGAFMLWVTKNNVNNGMTIGTDPYSADWHLLAKKLLQHNSIASAGDYSGYDGRLSPELVWAVLDLINLWYSDGNEFIREVMWLEIVNSWHVMFDQLFEFNGSMPSGNPLTALINSIANRLAMRWSWKDLKIPADYDQNVFLVVQGDDNLFTVSPSYTKLFNDFTIIEPLAKLGMVYTTETKVENTEYLPRSLFDVEFLKRSFRYDTHLKRYVGPLRLQKTLEMPFWTRDSDILILKEKVETVLFELALRGRKEYDLYAPYIIDKYKEKYGTKYGWFRATSYSAVISRATA